ncbi:ABC transporter permease [Martelella mediterranea]|uniref:ABC transporter permease n=1 Tax=Martelella mediterranea TaxID=293089 RepID=UPI001E51FB4B|nr:ABC transporter permease subunit [Martelella mediterranea]
MMGFTHFNASVLRPVLDRLGRTGQFLWSGFAGLAAFSLLAGVWQYGHEQWGAFILPSPLATLTATWAILSDAAAWSLIAQTVGRALQGFLLSAFSGALLGMVAGHSPATIRLARPLITILIGVPPIAWIVLALIWFGAGDGTVIATVVVTAVPIIFAGTAEGILSRDRKLDDMARVFGANAWRRMTSLRLRQLTVHLFPALTLALGMSFKVAVMAELLANVGGIGGELSAARSYLDITQALAWVMIAVIALLIFEYGVIHPVRSEFEHWRRAEVPWGIKR